MLSLSDLERAALAAIADQNPDQSQALREQIASATVAARENTGAGFYTRLAVAGGSKMSAAASPLGDVGVEIEGLEHGMGFLLWIRDGVAETLEGYTHAGSLSDLDLTTLRFAKFGPRRARE